VTVEILVSPQAVAQARAAQEWWEAHYGASPSLLHDELRSGLELLAQFPKGGSPYPNEQVPGVRRLLLRKCQYHIYYLYDPEGPGLVVVLGSGAHVGGEGRACRANDEENKSRPFRRPARNGPTGGPSLDAPAGRGHGA
jgi:plasmid stabilization system protein ParE